MENIERPDPNSWWVRKDIDKEDDKENEDE